VAGAPRQVRDKSLLWEANEGSGIGMLRTQYQGGLLCALLAAARRVAQRFRILC